MTLPNDPDNLLERIERLNAIGIALSAEPDTPKLLETILLGAKNLTGADGGSLYSMTSDRRGLKLEIMRTDSLGIAMGGTTGEEIPYPPVPLYDEQGRANTHNVVTCAVHHDQTIKISDAYLSWQYDFSGTREFDSRTGYRSKSFLTVPLKDHENEIIGVLQLINAVDRGTGQIVPFSPSDQRLTESLASQAAVALTTKRLINDLQTLFDSFVRMIATAIDEKSPHTGAHCKKVPLLTMMIADAVDRADKGPLADFTLDDEDRYQLELAAWLHDCGKITTPEHVVEKATKLQTIHDRIEIVDARFEVLRRDATIEHLEARAAALQEGREEALAELERAHAERLEALERDREFLHVCNRGSEAMTLEDQERVRQIAGATWTPQGGEPVPLLSANEVENLTVTRGTLTAEERQIIDNHALLTIRMLESLPFPRHLSKVPEYAGAHHERMDGTGYPRGLTREEMPIPARILAVADIFEALTASSRPYKRAMTISEALAILGQMKLGQHIDPDIFDVLVTSGIYRDYASQHLEPAQLDDVDPEQIPGFPG